MKKMNYIDNISKWTASIGTWMIPVLAITVSYDVFMRFVFRAPTFWAYETSWMLYSANFLLGLGYALREGSHVKVDIFLGGFQPKVKNYLEMFFLFLMFIFCTVVTWHGTIYAVDAWKILEGSHITPWAPPVYPIKTLIPIAFCVLGLQAIAEFLRKLRSSR
jgi:TRAP-type mannitol/chloroaromatic compound transport system permease small subunit